MTPATLSALASGGSTFAGWSGGGCSGTGTCTVSAAATVTATFDTVPGAGYHTLTPCRLVDTRDAAKGGPNPLAGGSTTSFTLAGSCSVPGTARAVSYNIASVSSTAAGNLVVFPTGGTLPVSSALNYAAGQTRSNNGILPVGAGGAVSIKVGQGSGTVHVILDVTGYLE